MNIIKKNYLALILAVSLVSGTAGFAGAQTGYDNNSQNTQMMPQDQGQNLPQNPDNMTAPQQNYGGGNMMREMMGSGMMSQLYSVLQSSNIAVKGYVVLLTPQGFRVNVGGMRHMVNDGLDTVVFNRNMGRISSESIRRGDLLLVIGTVSGSNTINARLIVDFSAFGRYGGNGMYGGYGTDGTNRGNGNYNYNY